MKFSGLNFWEVRYEANRRGLEFKRIEEESVLLPSYCWIESSFHPKICYNMNIVNMFFSFKYPFLI